MQNISGFTILKKNLFINSFIPFSVQYEKDFPSWLSFSDLAYALRDVRVTIPQAARIMDTVSLQCRYDLEGEPLYTVKWYKGSKEFFRFIPKELPNTQVFPLTGIDVDVSILGFWSIFFKYHANLKLVSEVSFIS